MTANPFDPTKAQNNEDIEKHWAIKAFLHAETYFKLISTTNPKTLKLTKIDDELYKEFRGIWPNLDLRNLSEDELKTQDAKAKWREFIKKYQDQVNDFNFGTLVRNASNRDYDQDNCFFVTRFEFLCIEIARNREGLNEELSVSQSHNSYDKDELEAEMKQLESTIAAQLQ
jgi:hypothetical protein